ncbi:MAG: VOC family protein [Candidatus Nanohaloarchaea archaeon]|nr:VOC family protein [Candidatus Nanohaloarchaea archaeon]
MTETPVDPDPPDAAFHTQGVDHITIWGSNEEDTIAFYRDVLGMPLVLRQPNLDDPEQTHLFFDTGDGRILTVFVSDERDSADRQRGQTGAVHHLSFTIAAEDFQDIMDALDERDRHYNVFDRGIFTSLYTQDNNGLVIELSADRYEIPNDRRGEVLAKTQEIRKADGADYAEDDHLRQALDDLGIEIVEHDLPDAATGVGVED